MRRIRAALAIVCIVTGVVSAAQKAEPLKVELPAPTGQYAVARESFHWSDHSRQESLTDDPSDDRELMVHIWYPADKAAKSTVSPYIPHLELLKSGLDDSQYAILGSVRTHTIANARLSTARARYPVLIFSHGNQMSSFLYTAIIEDLASHGYFVVAIDHPYEALFTVFPDNRIATYSEVMRPKSNTASAEKDLMSYLRQLIDNRAADMVFVINQLVDLNANKSSQFRGHLDLTNIGAVGHSNGGTAAAQACQIDKRIKACINLDGRAAGGPFYPNSNGGGPEQPLMYLTKPLRELSDEELAKQKITRETVNQERANTLRRDNELMQSVKSGIYRVVIKEATHESFSDEPLLLPTTSTAEAANQKTIRIVREYTLAFCDSYLTDKKPAKLAGLANADPEVIVERFGRTRRSNRAPQPDKRQPQPAELVTGNPH